MVVLMKMQIESIKLRNPVKIVSIYDLFITQPFFILIHLKECTVGTIFVKNMYSTISRRGVYKRFYRKII